MIWMLIGLFGPGSGVQAESADKLLREVAGHYQSIDDVCADFTQTFFWLLADESDLVRGRVCVKGGTRFRIETPDQIIVNDGTAIWTLSRPNEQVVIDHAEKSEKDNPFLKSFIRNYLENYTAELLSEQGGQAVLHLKAISPDQFQREITLSIDTDSKFISKIVQMDINGNEIIYELSNIDTDVKLDASTWQLQIPAGYDRIDMR